MLTQLRVCVLVVAAFAVTVYAGQAPAVKPLTSPANRQPWPPAVVPIPKDSPALSPADELKTFYMPPGYHAELVAADPLVEDPVAINFDSDGRMWVAEYRSYLVDLEAIEPNQAPICRIVVLEDTNRDGVMDKRTVFADGLPLLRSIQVVEHGVLALSTPNVWLMRDTNGDLKMDTKELIASDFGNVLDSTEHTASFLTWSMDNALYTSSTTHYLQYHSGKFTEKSILSRGEWGASYDDAGHVFRSEASSGLHVDLVPTQYYSRNPTLVRQSGSYGVLGGPDGTVVWPVLQNPGTNRSYQAGVLRPDGTLARYTSAAGGTIYRGDRLPADLYGNAFVAEPAANVISRLIVSDDGTTLVGKKAYDKGEFLASTDERFRPVNFANAPDGTLYVVDMYRGIIQGKLYITEYLHGQILSRNLTQSVHLGRIFRIMHDTTTLDTTVPALSHATTPQLVGYLSHPNGWWADTARRVLVEHGDKTGTAAIGKLAVNATVGPKTRIQALWTLDGYDAIDPATVIAALSDSSRDVRANALRVAERFLSEPASPVQAAVLKRLTDTDWQVREQLAASLGALPEGPRETAIATLLAAHGDDTVTMDAALSGLRGTEPAVMQKLLESTSAQTPAREAAITMIAATIIRGGQATAVQNLFAWLGDGSRAMWARSAVVRGAEVALLGAPMPGVTGGARGGRGGAAGVAGGGADGGAGADAANAPCPTCPGGRGGPGGGYAFARAGGVAGARAGTAGAGAGAAGGRVGAPAGAGGGRGNAAGGGSRTLRLDKEPVPLTKLASAGGDLGTRASSLLPLIVWPGKPGMAAPIAPLTAAEQTSFDAGSAVYKNICQGCHQADGRGQANLAANLIGSPLALAPAEVTVRILMNGKEGSIGLMAPLGATMSDKQVADVLTYVRREWGQTGTPVTSATVKAVRALAAARKRPWTNDELLALIAAMPAPVK
ncbi:MAG: c-type cytochrome [Vicinamibacterales bacterium]